MLCWKGFEIQENNVGFFRKNIALVQLCYEASAFVLCGSRITPDIILVFGFQMVLLNNIGVLSTGLMFSLMSVIRLVRHSHRVSRVQIIITLVVKLNLQWLFQSNITISLHISLVAIHEILMCKSITRLRRKVFKIWE